LMLKSGADKVSINTTAVENSILVKEAAEEFGTQCIVVAIDAKRKGPGFSSQGPGGFRGPGWQVFTYGGTKPTDLDAVQWAKRVEELGAGEILLTSMDQDGTNEGYDLDLTKAISESVNIPVIASGGAGSPNHLYMAFAEGKADAALAASIFHYGKFSIKETKQYLRQKRIEVRI